MNLKRVLTMSITILLIIMAFALSAIYIKELTRIVSLIVGFGYIVIIVAVFIIVIVNRLKGSS